MSFLKSYFVANRQKDAGKGASGKEKEAPSASGDPALPMPPPPSVLRSRPNSLHPSIDSRRDTMSVTDVRADVMCSWLYRQQLERQFALSSALDEGVVLKKSRESYACRPSQLQDVSGGLYEMAMEMNVPCAMTVNTNLVGVILSSRQTTDSIPMPDGLRLQVLPTMSDLPHCQKHQFAAFILEPQILVIWDDDPQHLLRRADLLEQRLVKMVWEQDENESSIFNEKSAVNVGVTAVDLEEAPEVEQRPTRVTSPLMVGVTMCLSVLCVGLGARSLAYEILMDGDYKRIALVAVIPLQFFVSLFFFQTIVVNLGQVFGPISAVVTNSKYYSGKAPVRLNRETSILPHVTIQMPVYKEGLKSVIMPTIQSLRQAISTYEMQGGTANIFINDDGMQLISEEDAQARLEFYEERSIGWVARPGHNPKPEDGARPFLRRGKFKKASNMNYAMMVSNRVEEKLKALPRTAEWNQTNENSAYQECLDQILEEDEGRTWAGGNIRIGDYILIIDSDTRVPADCLLDAVSEMEQSPEVAIIQFSSGVMKVSTSFFEAGITWFTELIYSAITFTVSIGDSTPFVGHNAMLRWSALQDVTSYFDEDNYEKFWSESHVSEDFDMALRLQCAGYIIRFASYTGDGFKEGVSLTVYDELARWEKYAYGCNELMFHPIKDWIFKGPITPLFRKFLFSNIDFAKKVTICAYIGTYYAIGAAWFGTLLNYFITGWFYGDLDKFYLDSFSIYFSVVVVFTGFGNIALAILRYRLKQKTLYRAFWENLKWIPLMTIFLGGIQIHVFQAIFCHFFSIDMTWGATAKEVEHVNFLEEVPRLFRRFKGTFMFVFLMTGLMVAGYFFFPLQWRIQTFSSIWPLSTVTVFHFLLPVALNPALMVFEW